ncbi:MAG: hypothetical protein JW748_09960 [Anaerolineales bacterium]|nr:hypothetical protein [Anaerolineales bacterium]
MKENKPDQIPHKRKRLPAGNWAAVAAFLGAGALPCPGCGTPLILHMLPLAALLFAARAISRRRRKAACAATLPPALDAPAVAADNQEQDGKRE